MTDSGMKIYICGHRNPDVDSIMSAYALADLKRRTGVQNVVPLCPGLLPERADWLFRHFNLKPPQCRNDVYLRIGDLLDRNIATVNAERSLFDAVRELRDSTTHSMPVLDGANKYLGMLSPYTLLSDLLNIGSDAGKSLTGREIYSSIRMIQQVLDAECLSGNSDERLSHFDVYVAAMSPEFFDRHLDHAGNEPAVIVGDRPEIHLRMLERPVKLVIITGNCPLEPAVIELAKFKKVTILRSAYDSATVIRRLKFSSPVHTSSLNVKPLVLSSSDMIRDLKAQLLASNEDLFPVCSSDGVLLGVLRKARLSEPSPIRMILVDHNETAQGIPGLEESPILEVVDHHRIGMKPTNEPIKITADVVGSTCTLVAGMYRLAGLRPTREIAGILLGGLVTDTLLFQSPTTTPYDRSIGEWLEKISGAKADELMQSLMAIDSPLAVKSSMDVIRADRKTYTENGYRFSLSQVEENNLELLHRREQELMNDMNAILEAEGLDFIGLLATDPVRGNSEFLIAGNTAVIRNLPYQKLSSTRFDLPGVLSRKKQLLPQILSVTAAVPKSGA